MPEKHAEYSPSSLSRFMAGCYGWKALKQELGIVDTGNAYADEGTRLHGIVETIIQQRLQNPNPEPVDWDVAFPQGSEARELILPCLEAFEERYNGDPDTVYPEFRVRVLDDFDCWGTSDLVIVNPKRRLCHVVDWKFGFNEVAADSWQMKAYAVGVRNFVLSMGYDIVHYELTIVQPKTYPSVRSVTLTDAEVKQAGEEIRKTLTKVAKGDCTRVPSTSACQYCPCKTDCPELEQQLRDVVNDEFSDLDAQDGLGSKLQFAALAKTWAKAVEDKALSVALNGGAVPGYKLVEGRALRKWRYDESETVARLQRQLAIDEATIYETSLRSLAGIEKLLGKKAVAAFGDAWKDLIDKPRGKLTLADDADPRPAIDPTDISENFEVLGD